MSKAALLKRKAARGDAGAPVRVDGDDSTEPPELSIQSIMRAAWLRRAMTAVLFAFVIAGALAIFGVNEDEVSAEGGGYRLTVKHAAVSRPGLETPWAATIEKPGGFDKPLQLRTTAAYFDLFDENGLNTEPDATRRDGAYIVMDFDDPVGDQFVVDFDARLSPASQRGESATTELLVDGKPVVGVSYKTRVMP